MCADRFPRPDFGGGYEFPATQFSPPAAPWLEIADVAAFAAAMLFAAWLVLKKRSRRNVALLSIFSIAYFGFIREGCFCPVGAIQNVAVALADGDVALPLTVVAFFVMPLFMAVIFGRVFCGGVCPLGAIQDAVLMKRLRLPEWLQYALGIIPYAYFGVATLCAVLSSNYLICRYDPFVAFFRFSGSPGMLAFGGGLLALSTFVGRPYCRFLCPYSVLLALCSKWSWRHATITPDECISCGLCEDSCPFGAIRAPAPSGVVKPKGSRAGLLLILALPLIGAVTGVFAGPSLAEMDRTVKLAGMIARQDAAGETDATLETQAFRLSGGKREEVFARADAVVGNYRLGAAILGAFLGLVIVGKTLTRNAFDVKETYAIDKGQCVSCARCFASCPRERLRLRELGKDAGSSSYDSDNGRSA